MAGETKANPQRDAADVELDALAMEIFTRAAAASPHRSVGEFEAIAAYRKAEMFLSARRKIHAGELKPKAPTTGPQLADCCCPNQPRNHPHNLVAAQWTDRRTGAVLPGDPEKLNRIWKWLQANPTPEDADAVEGHVARLGREFPELGWTVGEIHTARAIFPAHCKN